MTRISLKSAHRKTQVSRTRVRSIMSGLFGKPRLAAPKKKAAKKTTRKVARRKPASRKAA